MPRLLNINSYHYRRGGADAVYFDHAALMAAHGWENAYFAMHHPQNQASPWSDYFVDELQLGHDYSMLQKGLMATKVIWSREAQRKLERLISEFKPDIAHLHNIYHHLSPSILSTLAQAGIPVVLTAHDLKLACPSYSMFVNGQVCERCKGGNYFNAVAQRCVQGSAAASSIVALEAFTHRALRSYRRHVDRIIVPSQFFRDKFVEWGWSPEPFEYIPNWLDVGAFAPRYEPGDYFLYFGRLSPIKGIETLIKASALAKTRLVIAGTGPSRDACEALARSLGCEVSFAGFRSGADLHDLIRGARATVLPSQCYENAPLSILEAAALGKPVIGSAIGGIPELIKPGQTGWLFNTGDADSLAQILREVADAPGERLSAMGRSARAFVEGNFNQSAYLARIEALYSALMRQ